MALKGCFNQTKLIALAATFILLFPCISFAQLAGSRGGIHGEGGNSFDLPSIDAETAAGFIVIEGSAELRVEATKLRVVLAISGQGETAFQCQEKVDAVADSLVATWKEMGIETAMIYEDFIAILPQYKWQIEKQEGQDVAVERLSGYRMQVNMHVACDGEDEARQVIDRAFKQGITDIIGFDYWHPEIDEFKTEAMKQAAEAANKKSAILLGAVFDNTPKPINVREKTVAYFPAEMYESFANSYSETIDLPSRRNMASIRAFRPQNTYYRGLNSNADTTPDQLSLKPEITIVSKVRIYFASPAMALKQKEVVSY